MNTSPSLENITRALEPLGLYSLRTGSYVDRELAAYAAAFQMVEGLLEQTAENAFVQTASGDALAVHETLVGLTPRLTLDDAARRDLVLYRLGSAPFDFDREGMINSIRATGMEAELEEDPPEESLTVRYVRSVDPSLSLEGLKSSVRTVLPAHLRTEFDMGNLTWDMFEDARISWDDWDAVDMTWDDFDLNGHFIFG